MRTVSSNNTTVLPLGKQGENLAEKIIFTDPISWLKGYGTGTVQLLNQRPGEDTPYPVVISEESDGSYSWAVTAADTALAGQGKCELRYISGDTVVKSHTWRTVINDALGEPSDTPPESQQGWVDQVLAAGTSAQEAAKRAEAAAINQPYPNESTGTWWVWDAEAGAYKDTGISYGVGGGSVELDTTLKESGKAADAAAVGARLSTLSEEIVTTSESKVSAHNTGADTHSDIRLLIQGLTDRLNALADSDDTTLDQLSEVVAYIKSNRDLISSITTDKVSVADIVDNLTTNVANKPLSSAQGVALKALIDAITIPEALPNPKALTFTGAVTGTYDGSAPLEVVIPSGGGSSSGGNPTIIFDSGEITEEVNLIGPIDISKYSRLRIFGKAYPSSNSAGKKALQLYFGDAKHRLLCNAGVGKLFDTSGNPVSFLIYLNVGANALSTFSFAGFNAGNTFNDGSNATSSQATSSDGGCLVYSTTYDLTKMYISAQDDLSTRPWGVGTRIMVIGDD